MRRSDRRLLILAVTAVLARSPGAVAQDARTKPAPVARPQAKAAARTPAPAGGTQTAAAQPQPAVNDAPVKQLLGEWEKKSAELKTLDVHLKRTDHALDNAWDDEEYLGRAILQSPDHAWLNFDKIKKGKDGKLVSVPHERIICTGTEIWQYLSETKQILIFPLAKEEQKRAMDEGPLPFLFNMRAADAEARYLMSIVKETPEFYVLSVTPRLRIDQEAFSKAFLQLNRTTYLPVRIKLISPEGNNTKDYVLSDVKRNTEVRPENFKGVVLAKPWQVLRDPGNEVAPARKVGGRPPQAAPRAGAARR